MTLSAEDDHLMIADITRNLAVTLGELGRYQEAIKYHLEAVSIQRKYKGSFAIDLIDYFSSLALDYSYIGISQRHSKHSAR
jgi:tetratricopeptide (TPR) repeat protein